MHIRKTTLADVEAATKIYDDARAYMRASGNMDQWNKGYPNDDTVREDIERGIGYVCEDEGRVVAVFAFDVGREPTYDRIYDGEWKRDGEYAYIHRIAVGEHGRGIVDFCFAYCFARYPNLRIDTHRDNIPMQKVLARAGFEYCGIIYLADGDERLAYQKVEV